jgi:hypothetical protein
VICLLHVVLVKLICRMNFIVLHSLLLFGLLLLNLLCLLPVVLVKLLCRFSSFSCKLHVDKVTYLSFFKTNRCAKMVGTDPPEAAGSSSGQQQVQVSLPFNLLFLLFLQLYSIKW